MLAKSSQSNVWCKPETEQNSPASSVTSSRQSDRPATSLTIPRIRSAQTAAAFVLAPSLSGKHQPVGVVTGMAVVFDVEDLLGIHDCTPAAKAAGSVADPVERKFCEMPARRRRRDISSSLLRWRYSALAQTLLAGWREDLAARIGGLDDRWKSSPIAGGASDFRRCGFWFQILHGIISWK